MTERAPYKFHFSWPGELIEGRLLRRYHRILADVEVDGAVVVTAQCVNSGRMEGLVVKGARVALEERQHSIACENIGERTVQRGGPNAARQQGSEGADKAMSDRGASGSRVLDRPLLDVLSSEGASDHLQMCR